MLYYDNKLKQFARDLRKNMTEAEKLLWSKVRRKQIKNLQFYRQRIIGNYIVDFYCSQAKLVIELDGEQHYNEIGKEKDEYRDSYLTGTGLKVLHFTNKDVFDNLDGVLQYIVKQLL